MSRLSNRNIVLGVSGGIAAYKSAELLRNLQDQGANVRVVMTRAATEFITPLTMQALSGLPVHLDLLDPEAEAAMGHIELARWADCVLIAPATADLIARLCHGHADDLLTTLCLATSAPVFLAPAMNQAMWRDAGTIANIETLQARGVVMFGPAEGVQACGDVGPGRMLEPAQLSVLLAGQFESRLLDGAHVVITSGPTREAIDPVRYISNHSSGKMGFALAQAAADAGARVDLIAGPVQLPTPARVSRHDVTSCDEMLDAARRLTSGCDIFIACAAVADYRPATAAEQKLKKSADTITLELIKNPDILATVAAAEQAPFCVGFAAETENLAEHALGKLRQKKLGMIIANDVSRTDIGFGSDDNQVTVFWEGGEESLALMGKSQLAAQLISRIAARLNTEAV